jgi:hypothetical protein
MASLKGYNAEFKDAPDFVEKPEQSKNIKVISVLAALALTGAILAGYFMFRKSHEEKVAATKTSQTASNRPALPTKAQVFIDEPIRKGSQVTIGGRVQNISDENLSDLYVEIELEHKKDGSLEARTIQVTPGDLGPKEEGRYNLTLEGDYTNLKFRSLKTGSGSQEIGFKSAPGAKRPFEEPRRTTKTVIVDGPRSTSTKNGEEFINTPDNPARIP